ncbi:MAG: hypothetical protein J0I16_18770 [Rhizobiales bacterium]|nr:hypothetical protein [Hyphomicrobiales bacterium]
MLTAWRGCSQIRLRLALLAVMALAPLQAQAGLLDFLFGNRQPEPAMAPASPSAPHMRTKQPRKARLEKPKSAKPKVMKAERDTPVAEIKRQFQQIKALAEVAEESGITAAFMQDPTLRSGDIVVTPSGIAVFQGGEVSQRKLTQFKPLAVSRFSRRKDLLALQKASGFDFVRSLAGERMSPLVIHARGNSSSPPSSDNPQTTAQEIEGVKRVP